jgi:hypothetical protein
MSCSSLKEVGQSSDVPFAAAVGFTRVLKDGRRQMTFPSENFTTWDPLNEKPNPYFAFGPYDPYRIMDMKNAASPPVVGSEIKVLTAAELQIIEDKRRSAEKILADQLKKREAAAAAKAKKLHVEGQTKLKFGAAKTDISDDDLPNTTTTHTK